MMMFIIKITYDIWSGRQVILNDLAIFTAWAGGGSKVQNSRANRHGVPHGRRLALGRLRDLDTSG